MRILFRVPGTMWSCRWVTEFPGNMLPPSSGSRWFWWGFSSRSHLLLTLAGLCLPSRIEMTPPPPFATCRSNLVSSPFPAFFFAYHIHFDPWDGGDLFLQNLVSAHRTTECHNPHDHNLISHLLNDVISSALVAQHRTMESLRICDGYETMIRK
jgi:hypothetical protein